MEEEKCFLTFTCALDGDLLISLLPSLVQSRWSAAEELDDGGSELVVELEDAAVPGVGVDAQLRALYAPVQVRGESRGHHPVVVAVGDEGGLGDLRQIVRRAASPLLDRLQLSLERLHLDRGVTVDRALLEPVDERARGGLAGGVAVEEQELLRIRPGQGRPQRVEVGGAGDLIDVLTALRAGAGEDKLADKVGVLYDECLGDEAAEGEGEDVDLAEPEGLDEGVGVVGHGLDRVGHLAGGGADAAVVKGDDVVVLRDGVDDARVPVVQRRGQVDEEDHRDAALRAEFTVRVGDAAAGDGTRRGLRIRGHDTFVRAVVACHRVLLPCGITKLRRTITTLWKCVKRQSRWARGPPRRGVSRGARRKQWKRWQGIRHAMVCRRASFKPRSSCWPSRDRPPSRRVRSRPQADSRRWRSTTISVG